MNKLIKSFFSKCKRRCFKQDDVCDLVEILLDDKSKIIDWRGPQYRRSIVDLIDGLSKRWEGNNNPFLIHPEGSLSFKDILENKNINLDSVEKGDVVALIGDFNSISIATLLMLIDKKVIPSPFNKFN